MSREKALKRINEYLAKQEPQKVELGLVDDLRKYPRGYTKYESEGDGLVKKANRVKQELKEIQKAIFKWAKVGESIGDDIKNDLKQFEKVAKDLGFMPDIQIDYSNAVDVYDKYERLSQKLEKEAKDLL
jgi:seryl-tRNA synthetase